MKKNYTLMVVLAFASFTLFAQNTVWNLEKSVAAEAGWDVDTAWTNGVPDETIKTVFNVPTAADCILSGAGDIKQLVMGDNNDGSLLKVADGGVLTTHDDGAWSTVGYNASAEMIIEEGGVVNSSHRFHVGLVPPAAASTAILEVAGTLNGDAKFTVNDPDSPDWTAEVYVTTGGLIEIQAGIVVGQNSFIDVTGGMIISHSDIKDDLTDLMNAGKLTAEGGDEEPIIEWRISGEDTTTIVKSSTTVGTENFIAPEQEFSVYPNPASHVVYLQDDMVADVMVYSLTGQLVIRESQVSQVNVEGLKPGLYLMKAKSDDKQFVDKFIIE